MLKKMLNPICTTTSESDIHPHMSTTYTFPCRDLICWCGGQREGMHFSGDAADRLKEKQVADERMERRWLTGHIL